MVFGMKSRLINVFVEIKWTEQLDSIISKLYHFVKGAMEECDFPMPTEWTWWMDMEPQCRRVVEGTQGAQPPSKNYDNFWGFAPLSNIF